MEIIKVENLDFTYAGSNNQALKNINLHIESGQIVTLCGPSGSGKSTLLRHFKTILTPGGKRTGHVYYKGQPIELVENEEQVKTIGFVSQLADNQIVTDKVYHELAFGLESLGYDNDTIRLRVGEMATFFGITNWFHKDVNELSGGQKQILCLASVMTMLPEVIILDEPTSQLDPIAAGEFISMLIKINRELGVTIIISEHRLDELLPYSDRVAVMDEGEIIANDIPENVCNDLKKRGHKMFLSMPVPVKIWSGFNNVEGNCPLTINEGRKWLEDYVETKEFRYQNDTAKAATKTEDKEIILKAEKLWFRYNKQEKDILKGVDLSIYKGEIYGIMGGNGAGKSTLLSIISGVKKAYRGKIECKYRLSMLPQEPKNLFVKNTVEKEINEVANDGIDEVINICRLNALLDRNPYDLSGGEQQRVALAKVLLTNPDILLLDEPTKGLDNEYKEVLGRLLVSLKKQDKTIIMVSHDVEFCGAWTDRCGLLFDGNIISQSERKVFFVNNSFYTTATNRMARAIIPDAIIPEDVINVINGCKVEKPDNQKNENKNNRDKREDRLKRDEKNTDIKEIKAANISHTCKSKNVRKRYIVTAIMIFLAIPFTLYAGVHFFDQRKYLFISLLVILECIVPFFVIFEGRSPQARELVTISVLCAICIAGRLAFYMLPQFKPVMAIVILSGVTLGAETGFLVGAVTMFVSNIVFAQGAWTPFQMFAMGIVGFIAGIFFYKKNRTGVGIFEKILLALYGMVAAVIIYGGIMNPASALMAHLKLNRAILISYYVAGFPMDMVQGIATVIFLFLLSKPMIEKIERIKVKYI